MSPEQIVGFGKADPLLRIDQFEKGVINSSTLVSKHPADPVIPAGNDAEHFSLAVPSSVTATVECPVFSLTPECPSAFDRPDVGVTGDKTGFIALDSVDHGNFAFNGLRSIDNDNRPLWQGLLPSGRRKPTA